jgi:hypothetical protein
LLRNPIAGKALERQIIQLKRGTQPWIYIEEEEYWMDPSKMRNTAGEPFGENIYWRRDKEKTNKRFASAGWKLDDTSLFHDQMNEDVRGLNSRCNLV